MHNRKRLKSNNIGCRRYKLTPLPRWDGGLGCLEALLEDQSEFNTNCSSSTKSAISEKNSILVIQKVLAIASV